MRLVRPPERPEGDRLLDERHDLSFQQCAGCGLRSGTEGRGRRLALGGGWRTGGFPGQPREKWLGWSRELPCRRLHLRAHDTPGFSVPW